MDYMRDAEDISDCSQIALERTSVAYLTFKYPKDQKQALDQFQSSWWETLIGKGKVQFMENNVMVTEAPEPEEINWDNLHITSMSRKIRTAGTWAVCAILVISCLLINQAIGRKAVINIYIYIIDRKNKKMRIVTLL